MLRVIPILLLLDLLFLFPAAAVSVTPIATEISPGEPVLISLSGLPDGSRFSLSTEGIFPLSGEQLRFQLTNLTLPFSLSGGEILVTTENTRHVAFRVKKGDITTTLEAFPENGTFSKREARNISAGVYSFMLLEADPLAPDQPVSSVIHLTGTKQGPEDATLSFSIDGVEAGQIRITVLIDGTEYFSELMMIGSGGGFTDQGMVSPDGVAWLTGTSDSSARLLVINPGDVPGGWEAVTRSYHIVSSGTDLGSGALLTITVPATIDLDQDTLFIARARDGSWEMLPSRIREGDGIAVITAPVREPGEYCLMTSEVPETTVPATKASFPVILSLASLLIIVLARR